MNASDWFEREVAKYRRDPDFMLEQLTFDITNTICRAMDKKGLSRSDLARQLKVSPAYITKLLNSTSNLTLRTLVNLALALDLEVDIALQPRNVEWPLPLVKPWGELPARDSVSVPEPARVLAASVAIGYFKGYEKAVGRLSPQQMEKFVTPWDKGKRSKEQRFSSKPEEYPVKALRKEETELVKDFGLEAVRSVKKSVNSSDWHGPR